VARRRPLLEKRILFISPVREDDHGEIASLNQAKGKETILEYRSLGTGPSHLQYAYYAALILKDLLEMIKRAEKEGFDAVAMSCFLDPGLDEGREITEKIIIAGPGEASTHIASTMGDKFSVLVTERNCIPRMAANVARYGLQEKVASFKAVEVGVLDLQKDRDSVLQKIKEAGKEAIENDGAEVIILGCTSAYGYYEQLQHDLGVPVIDAGIAALKFAEFLAELKKQFGWSHSKIGGYQSPPKEEILEWGLGEAEVWQ